MKTMFKALLIYGFASAIATWIALAMLTLMNLVLSFTSGLPLEEFVQSILAGIALGIILWLLFLLGKALFGVASAGKVMGMTAKKAATMGMPGGSFRGMANALMRGNPAALRRAGRIADNLGMKGLGKQLRKGGRVGDALADAKKLRELEQMRNDGKIKSSKASSFESKENKEKKERLERSTRNEESFQRHLKSFVTDKDGNPLTGDELSAGQKEAHAFAKDVKQARNARNMFPVLDHLDADEVNRFVNGEMTHEEQKALGVDRDAENMRNALQDKFDAEHRAGNITDDQHAMFSEQARKVGGFPEDHMSPSNALEETDRMQAESTRERDEQSVSSSDALEAHHGPQKEAQKELPGGEMAENAMNVSQTINENNNANVNPSTTADSMDAKFSSLEDEASVAGGAGELPVAADVVNSTSRKQSDELNALTESMPGMPMGTTLDENGNSTRDAILKHDEDGNVISSSSADEVSQIGETLARGDETRGNVIPADSTMPVSESTNDRLRGYAQGMDNQEVSNSVIDHEDVTSSMGTTMPSEMSTDQIINAGEDSRSITGEDVMSGITQDEGEMVSRSESTQAQQSNAIPMPAGSSDVTDSNVIDHQSIIDGDVMDHQESTPVSSISESGTRISTNDVMSGMENTQNDTSAINESVMESMRDSEQVERNANSPQTQFSSTEPVNDTPVQSANVIDNQEPVNTPTVSESAQAMQGATQSANVSDHQEPVATPQSVNDSVPGVNNNDVISGMSNTQESQPVSTSENIQNIISGDPIAAPQNIQSTNETMAQPQPNYSVPIENQQQAPQNVANDQDSQSRPVPDSVTENRHVNITTEQDAARVMSNDTIGASGTHSGDQNVNPGQSSSDIIQGMQNKQDSPNVTNDSVVNSMRELQVVRESQAAQQQYSTQLPQEQTPVQQTAQSSGYSSSDVLNSLRDERPIPVQEVEQPVRDNVTDSGQQVSESTSTPNISTLGSTPSPSVQASAEHFASSVYQNMPIFQGDRPGNVNLSYETVGEMRGIIDQMSREMTNSSKISSDNIAREMRNMRTLFENDLRNSGQYDDDYIRSATEKMQSEIVAAFKKAMDRQDDFADERDRKNQGNLSNQGNTGKIRRDQ